MKGDAASGKELFTANACATCHAVTKDAGLTVGPNLVGVVGRKAGTTKSLMGPSAGLTTYGVTWNVETLNEFLSNPNAKVPGTAMIGMLADPQQRADVIAYLSTLKEWKKAPGLHRGLLTALDQRLTCRLVAPRRTGAASAAAVETTFTHSASLSLKYEVSLALRNASRLPCCRARCGGGESRQLDDHPEPLSSSFRARFTVGLSVVTLISVPARTLRAVTV